MQQLSKKSIFLIILLSTVSLLIVLSFFITRNQSDDIPLYEAEIAKFRQLEESALLLFELPNDAPTSQLLEAIDNPGLVKWNESLEIVDRIEQLDLPEEIKVRNVYLREYVNLRIKSYELIKADLSSPFVDNRNQIDSLNLEIKKSIDKISGTLIE